MLKSPLNHHRAVGLNYEQWHHAFTNTFDDDESRRLYERYAVPASGRILWNGVLANLEPGPQDVWVDYHNEGAHQRVAGLDHGCRHDEPERSTWAATASSERLHSRVRLPRTRCRAHARSGL